MNSNTRKMYEDMSIENLTQIADDLSASIDQTKSKIDGARLKYSSTGQKANHDWYSRAIAAKRIMIRKLDIARQVLKKKKQENEVESNAGNDWENELNRQFVRSAKMVLTDKTFQMIDSHAERAIESRQHDED